MRGWRLSPLGAIALLVLVAGIVALSIGSPAVQGAGLVAVVIALVFMMPPRMLTMLPGGRARAQSRAPTEDVLAEQQEYIPRAATPSEDAWAREQARYRATNPQD